MLILLFSINIWNNLFFSFHKVVENCATKIIYSSSAWNAVLDITSNGTFMNS